MTEKEAIEELKYARAMCEFNPSTGEVKFRNEEDRRQAEAFDIAISVLVENEKNREMVERFAEFLTNLELDVPCDVLAPYGVCEKKCRFNTPQKECWIRWALEAKFYKEDDLK